MIKKGSQYIDLSVRDHDVDKSISDRHYVSDYLGGTIEIYSILNERSVSLITKFDIDDIKHVSRFGPVVLGLCSVGGIATINDLPVGDDAIIFNIYNKIEHHVDYSVGFKTAQLSKE